MLDISIQVRTSKHYHCTYLMYMHHNLYIIFHIMLAFLSHFTFFHTIVALSISSPTCSFFISLWHLSSRHRPVHVSYHCGTFHLVTNLFIIHIIVAPFISSPTCSLFISSWHLLSRHRPGSSRVHENIVDPSPPKGGKFLYKGILLRYRIFFEYERTIPLGDRRSPPSGG